jgi:hypothetical protein
VCSIPATQVLDIAYHKESISDGAIKKLKWRAGDNRRKSLEKMFKL